MSNQLQHRLLHFEVEPPARMWEAINEALEDQSSVAADKLRHLKATPPANLWQQIEEALDSKSAAKASAVPLHKRYTTPIRYASAAAILVLVASAVIFFSVQRNNSREVALQTSAPRPARQVAQPSEQVTIVRERTEPQKSQAPTNTKERNKVTKTRTASAFKDNAPTVATAIKTTARAATNRYLTVASETGKTVRLSKKVYPVFDCAEHSDALERFQCQENIESLQKMASSLIFPSGDFASLIDMIKTLEENR